MTSFWHKFIEFFTPVATTGSVILFLLVVVIVLRRLGYRGSLEPIGLIEGALERETHDVIHVELRDSAGERLDFLKILPVWMHNGVGREYQCSHGFFKDCDSRHIYVGSCTTISVGRVLSFDAVIRLDDTKQTAYVQVPYARGELLRQLNSNRQVSKSHPGQ